MGNSKLKHLAGGPQIRTLTADDPLYGQLGGKTPQTLAQLRDDIGGWRGEATGPDGQSYEINLEPYKHLDPDQTFVILSWVLPSFDDLKGKPIEEAKRTIRQRLGLR